MLSRPTSSRWTAAPLLTALVLSVAPTVPASAEEGTLTPIDPVDTAVAVPDDLPAPAVPAESPALSTAASTVSYSVVDLGGGYESNGAEVNEEGAVAGTVFAGTTEQPAVWRGDQKVALDTGGATRVRAVSLGEDGTVGGWLRDAGTGKRYAVVWRPDGDGGYEDVERIAEVTGSTTTLVGGEAQSIGADGSVHVTEPRQHVPFGSDLVWRQGVAIELAPGAGIAAATHDMSDSGTVTGAAYDAQGKMKAAVWGPAGASPQLLADLMPDATSTIGSAVNDAGHVVAVATKVDENDDEISVSAREVALWRNGAWTDLGDLYGDETTTHASNLIPWDINAQDDVVGAAGVTLDGARAQLAFLWRDGRAIDLNTLVPEGSGWELNAAHSINDRGQITGIGTLDGRQQAFLLDPTRPLLFVPGAGASILKSFDDPTDPEQIWLGCGTDRMRLSRFPEDNPDQDVRAVDTTRYLDCLGLNGRSVDALNAYGGLLDQLTTKYGYREYQVEEQVERRTTAGCDLRQRLNAPNLFVFAYDWRQDNRVTARELEDYVGCIERFHPGVEIDVLTHSMGSLVARRYVMNHRDDHRLHKVVTVGAPWLGAPKLVNVINTGDFIDTSLVANGFPSAVKHVVSGFPAAHQLMSGPYYHDLAGSVFSEEGWDYDRDGNAQEHYSWSNLKAALDARWSRTAPGDTAESFQTQGGSAGQADWSEDPDGRLWTHVYGIQAGQNTIGRIAAVREVHCTPLEIVCVTHDYLEQRMTNGDGTVPTTSANRISGDDDLNAAGVKLVPVPVSDEELNGTVEHTALTRHPRTLKAMMAAFRDAPAPRALATDKSEGIEAPYRYVTLRGARAVVLHQGVPGPGPDDAPLHEDGTRLKLPGTQRLGQGEDAELVTMPAEVDHPWTVTFTGTGAPMSLESLEGTQESPEVAVRWQDVVVPEGNAAELTLTPTGLERLRIDKDGDGNLDTTVPPTSDLVGEDARDTEPPTVSLASMVVDEERRYVVEATDGRAGSGVEHVFWSTDGRTFTAYDAPIRARLEGTLHAFAQDHAGNRSPVAELDLFGSDPTPVTTLRLDPAPTASGWSAGTTTATLAATAGDGSPVASIRYYATGAQTVEETTVEGDATELVIDRPGRTTLWYQAVAEDGTSEAWRQRVLRLDAAPPSLRLRAPAAGAVVDSITQVAGTAADDAAGVRQVEVLLERTGDGRFWDGDAWVAEPTWLPAGGSATWRMTDVPTAQQLAVGAYAVRARATDGADRTATSPAVTFIKAYGARMVMTELAPPGGRMAHTTAVDVNDSGTVAGITGTIPSTATRWVNGSGSDLTTPTGHEDAQTNAVAADGSIAGFAQADWRHSDAVRWDADGSPHVLPHLPGADSSVAEGISPAGVVGVSGGRAAWWRDDGSVVALPTLQPGQSGQATDIDSVGTIVGHVLDAEGVHHAVVWTEGGREITDLGTLGGKGSAALGINDVGQVVGWAVNERRVTKAFVADVFEGETMTEAYVPTSTHAQANDIGDDGTIVGEYVTGDRETYAAFVMADGQFHPLSLRIESGTGWVPTRAYAINNLGQVAGFGLRNGVGRGFLASTPHAPVATDVVADTAKDTAVTLRLPADDPDPGSRLAVSVVDGPAHGSLSTVSGDEVTYMPARGFTGTDRFTFRATDGALRSNLATVTVRVQPGEDSNQRPVAVVTMPATVPEGSTVTLDGSASSDADGKVTAYDWDLDGDGAYDDATGPTAELTLGDQGVVSVALQVTDDDGATGVGSSSVEAVNVAPLVNLPPTAEVEADAQLRLQGGFSDPGRDRWTATVDTGEGPQDLALTDGAFTVTASWARPGTQQVTVKVCDGADCGTATTTVEVIGNVAPDAAIEAPETADEGDTVTLDGSGSTDSDGTIAAYAWDLDGDGAYDDATGAQAQLVVPQDGTHAVGLQVTDDEGATSSAESSVVVRNVAPVPDLAGTATAVVDRPWNLAGTFTDPGADTWTASADFGDGTGKRPLVLSGKAFTVSSTFATTGTHQVTVEVCDGGACGSRVVSVTVDQAPAGWAWEGFFAPVDNLPVVNTLQAGQAVPLKFSVGGYRGMDIIAAGHPTSQAHVCGTSLVLDAVEQTVNPGTSSLTYAEGTGRYQYVWKTQKSWAGQCRTFTLKLADGSTHTAEFRFR